MHGPRHDRSRSELEGGRRQSKLPDVVGSAGAAQTASLPVLWKVAMSEIIGPQQSLIVTWPKPLARESLEL